VTAAGTFVQLCQDEVAASEDYPKAS
jgi:hypothetical protein